MKLIMAVSKDGYVARSKDDDMSWTGPYDKAAFRMLTNVGRVLACGSGTTMPKNLPGRRLYTLSQKPVNPGAPCEIVHDLRWFQEEFPHGWLVGGLTIALHALGMDLVDQAFVCHSDRSCFPRDDAEERGCRGLSIALCMSESYNTAMPRFVKDDELKFGDCRVAVWNRRR